MDKIYEGNGIYLPSYIRYNDEGKPFIPKISDAELLDLYRLLKPIVEVEDIKHCLKKLSLLDLRTLAYTWSAKENKREAIDPSKMETVDEFACLHKWGFYGFFKPSVAEVLAQVPGHVIEDANAFEIVEYPETVEDLNRYHDLVKDGFHLSKVRSYHINK